MNYESKLNIGFIHLYPWFYIFVFHVCFQKQNFYSSYHFWYAKNRVDQDMFSAVPLAP